MRFRRMSNWFKCFTGEWVARALHAAAELGLADQLATVPKGAAELAGPMHVDANAGAVAPCPELILACWLSTMRTDSGHGFCSCHEASPASSAPPTQHAACQCA